MAEEDDYPSLNSSIVEERILARRNRISTRVEALEQGTIGEESKIETLKPKQLTKSEKQIEQSYQNLSRLVLGTSELITNVEVACHGREVALRSQEEENRKQRLSNLEEEAKKAADKFQKITRKWEKALQNDDAHKLQQILGSQKGECGELIERKNILINDLQEDLKQKDDQYVKDLRKQAEDVDLVLERMTEQTKTLYKAYREELDNIENALFSQRKELFEQQKMKWQQHTELRRQKEMDFMELREKNVEDLQSQLQSLRVEDAEEYNMVKIKLETDVQILEQNLQQMKATYQLNQEKLDYNFQVLKKRDEENMITKSQQKRKITRLQDLLNSLKWKLKKQENQCREENQSQCDDLRRITEQHQELQKKFRLFQLTDQKKYNDIWMMNKERTKNLVDDVLAEDRIIFEQQLGLKWHQPDLDYLHDTGPIPTPAENSKTALETAQEVFSETKSQNKKNKRTVQNEDGPLRTSESIRGMLELLGDESGFLVESKLLKLLAPIEKNDQSLITLDAIFTALGIETEEDIHLLNEYFYEVCEATDDSSKTESYQLIHPNMVFKALRKFLEDNREPDKEPGKQVVQLGKPIDLHTDEGYWERVAGVVDAKRERLWVALTEGFERYIHVLTERASLIKDTDALRDQNSELRALLRQYLNSKVNQELEIPPTKVLQRDISRQ